MKRPLIGVCAAVERASYGVWKDEPAVLLPLAYARAIHGAGGLVAMLPPDRRASEDPAELLERLDALLLAGGADIDAEIHGAKAHSETVGSNPDRDRFEIALATGARDRGIPLLGVCRGMQILNVALGGTLDQHLPERLGHEIHRPVPGSWAEHDVRIEPGSLAAQATGTGRLTVKSHHHQGLARVAENLRPSAWATDDETVEAVESPKGDFVLGVLWHPEEDPHDRVIPYLIEQAGTAQG
jgi:putative glutamine amidotransferase